MATELIGLGYDSGSAEHLGDIALNCRSRRGTNGVTGTVDDDVCVCVQKWGAYVWEPLSVLSASNWNIHKESINRQMNGLMCWAVATSAAQGTPAELRSQRDEMRKMLHELYQGLEDEEKRAFLQKHKDTFLAKQVCMVCLDHTENKVKCIHADCIGMCEACRDKHAGDMCLACGASQTVMCPVCQNEQPASSLARSSNCSHSVCWKCYGQAYKCGHPINACPVCRAVFTATAGNDQYGDALDSDNDTDDEDYLPRMIAFVPQAPDEEVQLALSDALPSVGEALRDLEAAISQSADSRSAGRRRLNPDALSALLNSAAGLFDVESDGDE